MAEPKTVYKRRKRYITALTVAKVLKETREKATTGKSTTLTGNKGKRVDF